MQSKTKMKTYKNAVKNKKHIIIEINTNREENYLLHKKIDKEIFNL